MSRSAKTNHVMSLVGKEQKTAPKPAQRAVTNKPPGIVKEPEIKNPALHAIICEQENTLRSQETETVNKVQPEDTAAPPEPAMSAEPLGLPNKGSRRHRR